MTDHEPRLVPTWCAQTEPLLPVARIIGLGQPQSLWHSAGTQGQKPSRDATGWLWSEGLALLGPGRLAEMMQLSGQSSNSM